MFNGAAQTGKTTCCEYLTTNHNAIHYTFKDALYGPAFKWYQDELLGSMNYEQFLHHCKTNELKEQQIATHPDLGDFSARRILIHVSEQILKPRYGKGCLGRIIADKIDAIHDPILTLDFGFIEEFMEVNRPSNKIVIIETYRDGFRHIDDRKYLGDMLSYLVDGRVHKIVNPPSQEALIQECQKIIKIYFDDQNNIR